MREVAAQILEIIGWGLILVSIILILLELSGLLHSPSELSINNVLTTGILALLIEMRVKLGLVWSDFRKRKSL